MLLMCAYGGREGGGGGTNQSNYITYCGGIYLSNVARHVTRKDGRPGILMTSQWLHLLSDEIAVYRFAELALPPGVLSGHFAFEFNMTHPKCVASI